MNTNETWGNGSIILYHVTPMVNQHSIDQEGISPHFARNKMNACWFVSRKQIQWGILHTSLRHNLPVSELMICACMIPARYIKKMGILNMYYTRVTVKPESYTPAEFFIETNVIQGEDYYDF